MSEVLHYILYCFNATSKGYWYGFQIVVIICFVLNMTATFLVYLMRCEDICPSVLNEFPYSYLFPNRISHLFVLLVGYVFLYDFLPKMVLKFLGF